MSIASENAKQIRNAMEVHVSLNTNVSGAYASVDPIDSSSTLNVKVMRSDATDQTDISTWPWRYIADFQGDGFPLDGSRLLWDGDTVDSPTKGVVGIRSDVGLSYSSMWLGVDVHGDASAVTLRFASTGGTIRANGETYEIRDTVVIPLSYSSALLILKPPDEYSRVELVSVSAGVVLNLDGDDITSCVLALRSDLSPEKPAFPASEIEIRAFWPNSNAGLVNSIDDGTPLTYYAGYTNSYSTTRHFYISEPIVIEQREIVIKAQDTAEKLDSYRIPLQALHVYDRVCRSKLYEFFRDIIKSSGIDLVSIQTKPTLNGENGSERTIVLRERSAREYVQSIMNLGHMASTSAGFWPVFVDAGIPRITWSPPTAKWTIKEEDCGEVKREVNKPVAALKTDDEKGVNPSATKNNLLSLWTPIFNDGEGAQILEDAPGVCGDALKVTAGKKVTKNFDLEETGYFWDYKFSGQSVTTVWKRINSICFIPSKTSTKTGSGTSEKWSNKVKVLGKEILISDGDNPLVNLGSAKGRTIEVEPITYGFLYTEYTKLYPNYDSLFDRSGITGSFLWKGDPRMQPRDVFIFKRLDGTEEACTIESIELKHEGGGTTATISYRLGVV